MRKALFLIFIGLSMQVHAQKTYPKREFRGVWVATVVNIDWPSQNSLSTGQQQKEFVHILDKYKELNFNAVVVQVRAAGDAFYESSTEPWSKYLTGVEGKSPEPYYDPLKWMIAESHRRGLEFHAWFNPYRATFDLDTLALADNHAFNKHREWMLKYGKRFYFNPGLPEVIDYTTDIIMEVVNNYDIDAVHFDDYFYPYKIQGEVFQDSAAFFQFGGDVDDIEDWRRANVDSLVKDISDSIRSMKPWVQFGISPFGVWRNANIDPKGSDTQAGQTTYDDLYADPLKWAENEWVDYLVPQLYWSMNHPLASHSKLVGWWARQEIGPHLYIGHGTYKVKNNSDKAWNRYREIPLQIDLSRETEAVNGSVFFSAKSLQNKHKRLNRLIGRKYKYIALPPPAPFQATEKVKTPDFTITESIDGDISVVFKDIDSGIRYLMVYGTKKNLDLNDSKYILYKHEVNSGSFKLDLDKDQIKRMNQIGFSYINKYGQESKANIIALKRGKLIQTNSN